MLAFQTFIPKGNKQLPDEDRRQAGKNLLVAGSNNDESLNLQDYRYKVVTDEETKDFIFTRIEETGTHEVPQIITHRLTAAVARDVWTRLYDRDFGQTDAGFSRLEAINAAGRGAEVNTRLTGRRFKEEDDGSLTEWWGYISHNQNQRRESEKQVSSETLGSGVQTFSMTVMSPAVFLKLAEIQVPGVVDRIINWTPFLLMATVAKAVDSLFAIFGTKYVTGTSFLVLMPHNHNPRHEVPKRWPNYAMVIVQKNDSESGPSHSLIYVNPMIDEANAVGKKDRWQQLIDDMEKTAKILKGIATRGQIYGLTFDFRVLWLPPIYSKGKTEGHIVGNVDGAMMLAMIECLVYDGEYFLTKWDVIQRQRNYVLPAVYGVPIPPIIRKPLVAKRRPGVRLTDSILIAEETPDGLRVEDRRTVANNANAFLAQFNERDVVEMVYVRDQMNIEEPDSLYRSRTREEITMTPGTGSPAGWVPLLEKYRWPSFVPRDRTVTSLTQGLSMSDIPSSMTLKEEIAFLIQWASGVTGDGEYRDGIWVAKSRAVQVRDKLAICGDEQQQKRVAMFLILSVLKDLNVKLHEQKGQALDDAFKYIEAAAATLTHGQVPGAFPLLASTLYPATHTQSASQASDVFDDSLDDIIREVPDPEDHEDDATVANPDAVEDTEQSPPERGVEEPLLATGEPEELRSGVANVVNEGTGSQAHAVVPEIVVQELIQGSPERVIAGSQPTTPTFSTEELQVRPFPPFVVNPQVEVEEDSGDDSSDNSSEDEYSRVMYELNSRFGEQETRPVDLSLPRGSQSRARESVPPAVASQIVDQVVGPIQDMAAGVAEDQDIFDVAQEVADGDDSSHSSQNSHSRDASHENHESEDEDSDVDEESEGNEDVEQGEVQHPVSSQEMDSLMNGPQPEPDRDVSPDNEQ